MLRGQFCVAQRYHGEGRIMNIVNNYSRISFNFGPTLLAWMEEHTPDVLAAILEADRLPRERFSGHGCGRAGLQSHDYAAVQRRDKVTQVRWGIRDFESRFGASPKACGCPKRRPTPSRSKCLPRTASGSPFSRRIKARQIRRMGEPGGCGRWPGGSVEAVQVNLPSGRRIAVFFYDAPVSRRWPLKGCSVRARISPTV